MGANPATLVLPDINGAIMLKLRGDARLNSGGIVTNPDGGRVWTIAPQLGADWPMPTWAIVLRRAGGAGSSSWQGVPVKLQRFDIWFYGPGDNLAERGMNADRLWRTAHPILCPPVSSGVSRAFNLSRTVVLDVVSESEPVVTPEPETQWVKLTAPYVFIYSEWPSP